MPVFNPLATNKFCTRSDVAVAGKMLFEPLLPHFSAGKARVQLDASSSTHDGAACELEGWARPLWGVSALVAGGGTFDHWNLFVEGLKNGCNPHHREYWGEVTTKNQRQVESAAIGFALLLVPKHLWEPLDEQARSNVAAWLLSCRNSEHVSNNHMWFRVMVDLGLENVGVRECDSLTDDFLDRLEGLYICDGFYRDGDAVGDDRRIDYYNPWAMHLYGLLYAKYRPRDMARGDRFKTRAAAFAQHFQHWFEAESGANIPYGRSLLYRFCAAAFWGALALNDVEVLPYGVMKGLYLRNLRWWASRPICRNGDGILTMGYTYPNQYVCERYSSSGSPYWALKAFVPLILPPEHAFWSAKELPLPQRNTVIASPVAGMVFIHQPNHTVLLTSGPETSLMMRGMPEKYLKFAYSSRYGFSINSDERGFWTEAHDNMIAFSDDGKHYRVREHCEHASIIGDMLCSTWYPFADVQVTSILIPCGAWHIRVHKILSPRRLSSIEGGFAVPRSDMDRDRHDVQESSAGVITSTSGDFSGILNYQNRFKRLSRVQAPHGNTNVMSPATLVPQLFGDVVANVPTVFACAVIAGPVSDRMQRLWEDVPVMPSLEELEAEFADAEQIGICRPRSSQL